MNSRLGLFGGTFNPIHHGHLIAVQETANKLSLDSTLLVPNHHPPHREEPDVGVEDRARMTELAISGDSSMNLSRIEIERDGPSYTVETVKRVKEKYCPDSLFLLVGADQLLQFREWYRWETILNCCRVVGMSRPGFDRQAVSDDVLGHSKFVEIPEIDISSSIIRSRLRGNEFARYFLPESVRDYIRDNELYGL